MADTPAQKAAQRAQIGVELPDSETPEPFAAREPERLEGLPEKFNSLEELVKSYGELETELRTRAEAQKETDARLDSMQSMMEAMQAQPAQQPQYQPATNEEQLREQLNAAYEADPVGLLLYLANAASQNQWQQYAAAQQPELHQSQTMQGELIADNASRLLETRYPDWRDYEQAVGAAIEANPNLLPPEYLTSLDATASALEAVYKQLRHDDLEAQLQDARNGVESSAMKRNAQTMSGTAGRPPEPSDVDVKMAELLAASRGSSYSAFRGR
jgi:hypothetical protein